MPDEKSPQPPERRKTGGREAPGHRDWIFKPLNREPREATGREPLAELECARRATRLRGQQPGPTKMYHPGGCFQDELGDRFDYVFPELLEDPALPPWVFERVPFLLRGTTERFQPRRATREAERIVVGLRYGHGDLPRTVEES